ncbi:MAG: pilus assembly protein PilM [Phycisphaerales bacterium]
MISLSQSTRLSSIGIEFDQHEFHAVQLIRSKGSVRLLASAVFPRQHKDPVYALVPCVEELEWAKGVLERRGFVGNTVSITPPTGVCSSHNFELPPAESGAPLDQIARMEIARDRRCSPTDFELGYWTTPPRGRTTETLAVACPRKEIDQMIDGYQQVHLAPVGMDLKELAMARAHEEAINMPAATNSIHSLLHIGWTSSLAVICVGPTVVYIRRIEHGAEKAWALLTKRYQLNAKAAESVFSNDSATQALHENHGIASIRLAAWSKMASVISNELDTAIAYVSHAYRMAPIGNVLLSGYGASESAIHHEIEDKIGTKVLVSLPDVLQNAIGAHIPDERVGAKLIVAYGLAGRFDQ